MDAATFNDLPNELKEAASESFAGYYTKYDSASRESLRKFEEAIREAKARRTEHKTDLANKEKYQRLLTLIGKPLPEPPNDESSPANEDNLNQRRVIHSRGGVKDDLRKLIENANFLQTEQNLWDTLRSELNTDNIQLKTVQNRLGELANESVVKKYKSRGSDEPFYGRPDMFYENGQPKERFIKVKGSPSEGIFDGFNDTGQ